MIVSCWEPDRLPQASSTAEQIWPRFVIIPTHQLRAGTTEIASKRTQAAEGMPLPDRDETDFEYGCGLSLGLISPSPPHGQDTRGCHQSACIDRGLAPSGGGPPPWGRPRRPGDPGGRA